MYLSSIRTKLAFNVFITTNTNNFDDDSASHNGVVVTVSGCRLIWWWFETRRGCCFFKLLFSIISLVHYRDLQGILQTKLNYYDFHPFL